ncbi:MAG: hypothetical protein ACP5VF_05230 [Acidobacteriota bacterium]
MANDLRSYFERIEESFCTRRGAPLLLSPLDFEKAVEWFAAGIPPEVVEEGISEYFSRLEARKVPLRRAICLAFAEECVLRAREAHRRAAVGRSAGIEAGAPPGERVKAFLSDRVARLKAFSDGPFAARLPVLARLCASAAVELEGLLPRCEEPMSRLEGRLAPLDRELCRLVLLEAPAETAAAWRREAVQRLGSLAQSMDEEARRQTVEKLACQAALRELGLPRLSLLFMEGEG